MKRIVSVLLVCVMLVPMFAVYSSAAYENTYINTGNQIEDIIGVAMTQVGYKEGNSSSQLSGTVAGSGNYTKYGKWYGINPGAWCAMFVSWCANQAGISTSVIPKHASCDVGMTWFKNNGRWQYSRAFGGSYTPKRGDIIYFGNIIHRRISTIISAHAKKKHYRLDNQYQCRRNCHAGENLRCHSKCIPPFNYKHMYHPFIPNGIAFFMLSLL